MSTSKHIHPATLALFERLATAWRNRPGEPFLIRPIKGYAFAWILHPGFEDGTRMTGLPALSELEQAGLLSFTNDGFPTSASTFVLTETGVAFAAVAQRNTGRDRVAYESGGGELDALS